MKVLDRAFIKAYEMGDVDPASVATLPEAPVRTPVVASVTVIEKPTPAPVRTSPAPAPLDLGADFLAGISVTAEVEAGIDLSVSTRITRPTPSATGPATRPLLQVDRFAWPEICDALVSAQPEFLPLVEELLACAIETPRLLAITSRHRGEGRTTFLLTVARLLAARGCKVAMVDGDFQNPQLARQLGILPEAGWEDVLSGRLPLPEVLIESNEDQIALLPLRGPVHKSDALTRGPRTASTLDALRLSYQLVLVDVGTLSERARDLVPLLAAGSFDAALLVRDIRMTSPKELSDAAQRLVDAGIQTYGIAENFVSES
jgi:Mrp family chromosome partitioning ATPase